MSGAVDNNLGRDYSLPLDGAPTEEELVAARAALIEEAEERRLQVRLRSLTNQSLFLGSVVLGYRGCLL